MAAATSSTLGVFGYLPGQPDFVRVRAAGREVRRLEEWLEQGLHQARWEMGGGFQVAYPRLFHRFIFRLDNSEQVVIGVLCASLDCHQRPFPFVAFDLVPTEIWDRDPAGFIGRNPAFFATLENLVRTVGPLSHIGQVHGHVASANVAVLPTDDPRTGPDSGNGCEAARYKNFLQETTCANLGGNDQASGGAILHDLLGLLGSGQDPRLFRQALALALCSPLFARELELRFYLSFLDELLAIHRPTVTLFWQLGGASSGTALLSFREPTLDLFSALLCDGKGARGVYRPGIGAVPLSRPRPGLTDATSLDTVLEMLASKPQRTQRGRQTRNGSGI